ncbi:hypothetical protein [Streptomyces sp. NPDC042319]|uniref:hypothetical protein n=1 Tax=Streptomyces sp. NPDC042319 TaxID=3154332 RepID=UPI0033F2CCA4
MTPSRWLTAILSALLGTTLLLAAPTTAMAAQHPTEQRQSESASTMHTTAVAASAHGSHVHKHSGSTVHRPTTKTVHKVSVSKEKPTKKKRGFFKKLGIFLVVLLILFIVVVALLIWLLVRFVRKAFRRRA